MNVTRGSTAVRRGDRTRLAARQLEHLRTRLAFVCRARLRRSKLSLRGRPSLGRNGEADSSCACGNSELLQQVVNVAFHGELRDRENVGDLAVAAALPDQREDLALAARERGQGHTGIDPSLRPSERVQYVGEVVARSVISPAAACRTIGARLVDCTVRSMMPRAPARTTARTTSRSGAVAIATVSVIGARRMTRAIASIPPPGGSSTSASTTAGRNLSTKPMSISAVAAGTARMSVSRASTSTTPDRNTLFASATTTTSSLPFNPPPPSSDLHPAIDQTRWRPSPTSCRTRRSRQPRAPSSISVAVQNAVRRRSR